MSLEMEKNQNQNTAEPASSTVKGDAPAIAIPDDAIVVIPVRNMILFPGMILPLNLGRESSVAAAQHAMRAEKPIGLLLQKDPTVDNPGPDDMHRAGTLAQVLRYVTTPDGGHHLICQGQDRIVVRDQGRVLFTPVCLQCGQHRHR